MLQAIRDKAQGIFAWAMLILVGIPFAFWGINNYFDSGKEAPVAVVGDRDFFERDLVQAYQQDLANLVGLGDVDEKQLKRQALERLVRDELISQAAAGEGLAVPDSAVRAFIQTLPYFQTDGKFDRDKYDVMLSAQGMNSPVFAEQVKRALLMEQFQRGITDTAFATKQQVIAFFRLKNQEREIEFATVPLAKADADVTESSIDEYYRSHQDEFQSPETVTVSYLSLSLDGVAKEVQPTEEDLRNFYEEQKAGFTTEERRKVSHILVTADLAKPEEEAAALAKINQIRDRLLKGEDFAKVAKETSDDRVSAEKGGDLGVVTKGAMEPNFEKAALALSQGAVSEPVRTSFGYHLITVTELVPATTKPYDQVKDEVAAGFRRNAAENRFYDLGQKLTESAFEHPDTLEPAAQALGLKVEESGPFTREDGEGIFAEEGVRKAAFSEEVLGGKNSDVVEVGADKVVVLRLKEHRPAEAKPLAEVRGRIVTQLRDQAARQKTQGIADAALEEIGAGKTLGEVAKAHNWKVTGPLTVKRDASEVAAAVVNAAFGTRELNRPILVALENGDQAILRIAAIKEGEASPEADKDMETVRQSLARSAGQKEFAAFVAEMRRSADVYIKPDQD
ncbi:SurA N-terminal domain-containing protein [Methylococcus sp. Mc7]|uniref:SurA N-terminal domain-containing protein n=1 Tax=Methylococcus sp. Mc7 TaxID=2860258 RepID=UPI001C527FE0|nr:SurA N-terminal domain-containing protein [Methylococcus sp. Mc7]QXP84678.1 SurA N-terminal domain-containing protein [Methylococcus sp. Mc7]